MYLVLYLDKCIKLAGMVGKGLLSNIFNGSKISFHYFQYFQNGRYLPGLEPC